MEITRRVPNQATCFFQEEGCAQVRAPFSFLWAGCLKAFLHVNPSSTVSHPIPIPSSWVCEPAVGLEWLVCCHPIDPSHLLSQTPAPSTPSFPRPWAESSANGRQGLFSLLSPSVTSAQFGQSVPGPSSLLLPGESSYTFAAQCGN